MRTKDTPRAESASQNARSQTVAEAVDGLDEQLTVLERGRSELAKLDGRGTRKQQRANKALAKKMDTGYCPPSSSAQPNDSRGHRSR